MVQSLVVSRKGQFYDPHCSTYSLLADDLNIWWEVKCLEDAKRLQQDLKALSLKDTLPTNVRKCLDMSIGKEDAAANYTIVALTSGCKYSLANDVLVKHIRVVAGLRKLLMFWNKFSKRTVHNISINFSTTIRITIENCVQSWHPYIMTDNYLMEQIQRKGIKLVCRIQHLSNDRRF